MSQPKLVISLQGHDSIEIINVVYGTFDRSRNVELFHKGSNEWIFLGVSILNNFGRQVNFLKPLAFFEQLQTNKSSLWYLNGKPKFRIVDLDHGTRRQWGQLFKPYEVNSYYAKD